MTQSTQQPAFAPPPPAPVRRAPFLVWPVARREFYASIASALLLPLLWGILILGWRALALILAALAGALMVHLLLRRFTRRGRQLLLSHTLLTALMIAALAQAQWPPLILAGAGAGAILLVWLWGGPGHERIHSSLLAAVLLPVLFAGGLVDDHTATRGAIVARDRLFMGDINADPAESAVQWPRSREIKGHDAVIREYPYAVVADLLRQVSQLTDTESIQRPRSRDSTSISAPATEPARRLDAAPRSPADQLIDEAMVDRLPSMEALLLGIFPGRIGVVSALGILLGGLYLAYRNILRPYSVALFLASVVAGFVLITLYARLTVLGGVGFSAVRTLESIQTYLTLICYEFFSGDVLLATVFILAMPGTEPITPRGRRWFLIFAGVLAAMVHRLTPSVPACTLVLLVLQPFTWLFDYLMARKSWLNYGPRV